ncbi:RimK family alpha-L-glutamate ligase [Streptomyces sp. JJ36]|uniref:ATP-grasp domain-containing protein n=1 Tax=Streptomyces sp. JJ36 TaxID=2736645 RepID=UPI001F3533B3|nr:hypothetical protein [Streptomyces sp. JJ36]MCF6524073.1 hypothetical protein [Streptomyces sp. JJ36]
MPDIVLATGRTMPRPVPENDALVTALAEQGLHAEIRPWDEPLDPAATAPGMILVRSTWDYSTRREQFLAWARDTERRTLLRNPAPLLEWNSHKGYLPRLAGAGVPVVPTALVPYDAPDAARTTALAAHDGGDVVIKPAVSVGGIGALRAPAAAPEAAEHLASLVRTGDALVQPFAPAVTTGETSLVFFGDRFSHAVRKIPAEGEFRVHERYGGTVAPHTPSPAELAAAETALKAAPTAPVYARVDLVALPEGPAVMELELIEPELFLFQHPQAPERYARHLAALL